MSERATKNPHADPRILCGGGRAWVDCRCGWTSPVYRTAEIASVAWASHVEAAGSREEKR